MTLQEITKFIEDNRIPGSDYGVLDEESNLRAIMQGNFDALDLQTTLIIEKDRDVQIKNIDISGDNFIIGIVFEEGVQLYETFYLHPVAIYTSEKVKQIVNNIQND